MAMTVSPTVVAVSAQTEKMYGAVVAGVILYQMLRETVDEQDGDGGSSVVVALVMSETTAVK
jgi:hypothetical protein